MLRRITLFPLLILLTLPTPAQDAATATRIPVAFMSPEIALSPDGTTLAVYENPVIVENEALSERLPIRLIDIAQGTEIGTLEGPQTDLTRDAAFSPDGSKLASYHLNGQLIIWDVASREAAQVVDWMPFGGGAVDFRDGDTLVLTANSVLGSQQLLFDIPTGSVTNILAFKPATYQEGLDTMGNLQTRGQLTIAATAIGANGEIYGATANGEVFVWDEASGERITLLPEGENSAMRFGVRGLLVLPDNTLAFYHTDSKQTVMLGAGGETAYDFGGLSSDISDEGLLAYVSREEHQLYLADLNAADPAPQVVSVDLGGSEDALRGMPALVFTPDGDLILGALLNDPADNAVYVIDLP